MGSSDFCHGLSSADKWPAMRSSVTDLPCCVVWRLYVLRPIPLRVCPCASVLDMNTTGLRRYQGGSTPALHLSRPAQASLALRPVHLLIDHTCRPLSLELRPSSHPLGLPGSYPGIPTIPEIGLSPTVSQHLCTAHTDKGVNVTLRDSLRSILLIILNVPGNALSCRPHTEFLTTALRWRDACRANDLTLARPSPPWRGTPL
jgi:hypothetical protein